MPESVIRTFDKAGRRASVVGAVRMSAGVYINFAKKSFERQLAYKFEYFMGVFNGLLFIFIFTSLWESIYSNPAAAAVSSFDRRSIISYAVFAMIIRISMTMEDSYTVIKVRTGAISMDMIKPVNYFAMCFSEMIGLSMYHWFTRALPLVAVSLALFDVTMPGRLSNYALAFVAWILGYLIMFMINFLFGLLAFWVIEVFSFQLMKYGMFTLFSGGILPVDFFPDWARPLIDFIPFQYVLYVPTSLFIGHVEGSQALRLIGLQIVWVAALSVGCWWMWTAAHKKLVVQGG